MSPNFYSQDQNGNNTYMLLQEKPKKKKSCFDLSAFTQGCWTGWWAFEPKMNLMVD